MNTSLGLFDTVALDPDIVLHCFEHCAIRPLDLVVLHPCCLVHGKVEAGLGIKLQEMV